MSKLRAIIPFALVALLSALAVNFSLQLSWNRAEASAFAPQSLLANTSVAGSGTVCTGTFTPPLGSAGFAFFVFADQSGTVQLRRIDPLGNARTRTAASVTASTEDVEYVLQPWGAAQICYTNGTGSTAHVWIDANGQGGSPR